MVSLSAYLTVALIVFCIGLYGVLSHKNVLIVFLSIELMLNAVNLNFIAFTKYGLFPNISGQVIVLFVMTVAALEVAIGIAILLTLYRNKKTINLDEIY